MIRIQKTKNIKDRYERNSVWLHRLQAVSLFLKNPLERMQNKYACECDWEPDLRVAMPRAGSSVGIGRRAKRETALVSYNDLKAQHPGDGVILLVGLRSYDTHLSVTFIIDTQHTPKLYCNVCLPRCNSNRFVTFAALFWILILRPFY